MFTYLKFKTNREKKLFFINEFKKIDKKDNVLVKTFTLGYCYYFALILNHRFGGKILYDIQEGHFVTKIGRYIYEITGDVTEKYKDKKLLEEKEWKSNEEIIYGCIKKYIE